MAIRKQAPPLSRARADQLLSRALARVREINDDPGRYSYRFRRLAVLGSYLRDADTLNDLDLGIDMVYLRDPRLESAMVFDHGISHARKCLVYLRQRCLLLHLHDIRALEDFGYPYRLVFTLEE